jgi:hypothetical protein
MSQGTAIGRGGVGGRGRRGGLVALLAALLLGVVVSPAFAGKTVDGFLGSVGGNDGLGGRFVQPRDAAVVEASGDLYVIQAFSNPRVQRLDADGSFELAWGRDVVKPGATGDTGTGFEVCTVASDCKQGVTGPGAGEFDEPTGIAVNQVPGHPQEGHVYVRDTDNVRVQEFDADGNFVRAWGWGVATGAAAFEICTTSCLQGLSGSGDGQLGTTSAFASLEVDPTTGNVYVADPANRRIQEFEGDGDFVAKYGTAGSGTGQFGSSQPVKVAVDSNGIVYATDSNASNRIQRYDTTTDAFLAPIGGASPLLSGQTQGIDVDPTNDHLLAIRDPSSGETVIQELDTTTLTITDTHAVGEGFGFPAPNGSVPELLALAVDGARGKLYIPGFVFRGTGFNLYQGVYVLDGDGANDPLVSAGAPLSADDDSATLSGTVDPNGPAFYRFEYSKDGVDWNLVDGTASVGSTGFAADIRLGGSVSELVSAAIEGLESNTVYRARIVATKVTSARDFTTYISGEATFLTDAVPPAAVTSPVHSYTDFSAWLAGRVNPKGSATSYRFEWGVTTDYAHQAPAVDGNAGAGGVERAVLEEVSGLEPDTVYHYRLVADSAQGSAVGTDRTFRTRPASGFAGRGYEQVTPAVKSVDAAPQGTGAELFGTGVANRRAAFPVASDGSSVVFSTSDALEGSPSGGSNLTAHDLRRRAVRGSDGWSNVVLLDRPPGGVNGVNPSIEVASPDLSRFVVSANHPLFEGAVTSALYLRQPLMDSIDQIGDFAGSSNPSGFFGGASDDLSRVFFGLPDGSLHEWVGGMTQLVSVDPGGVPLPGESGFGAGVGNGLNRFAVSDDGEHAFFSSPATGDDEPLAQTQVYRRSGGVSTVLASPSKRSTPDPQGPLGKVFQTASTDGDRVFFTSSEQLTDDSDTGPSRSGVDLYRYEVSTDTLVDVSAEVGDGVDARVRTVLGASEDGDRVYYLSCDTTSQGPCPDGVDLHVWHDEGGPDGQTRLIATLESRATDLGFVKALTLDAGDDRPVRVSPDGKMLLFHSAESLTGYRNQGFSQVFVYEAEANDGEGILSCVSCRPNGTPAHGDSAVPMTYQGGVGNDLSRALSEDGRRVFFNSADALLPQDVNGEHDVYEWEAGRLRLLSSGTSAAPSDFVGSSESGDDVFFATRDRLVGQDRDGLMDVYDARVGGGFASQNPVEQPGCVGEACKPAVLGRPALPPLGSGTPTGAGDYSAVLRLVRITRAQARLLSRRGRVALRVDVDGPGRISVRAFRGSKPAGSGAVRARRAGVQSVGLRLDRKARKALSRRGRLHLRIEVRFAGETETAVLNLRRAK